MSKAYHTNIYFYFTAVMTVSFAQLLFVTLSWWLAPSRHLNCMWLVACLSALALWWTGLLLPSTAGTDSSLMFTFTEVQLLENMIRPGVGAELETVTSYLVRGVSVNIKWHFNPCFALSHAYLVGPISAFNWQVYVLALARLWWLMKQLSVHPICGWNQHPAARCLASAGCYHCCQLKLSHQHEMVLMDPGPVASVQLQYNWIQSNGFHTSVSLQASY